MVFTVGEMRFPEAQGIAKGTTTFAAENWGAAREQMIMVDNVFAREVAERRAMESRLKDIKEISGQDIPMPIYWRGDSDAILDAGVPERGYRDRTFDQRNQKYQFYKRIEELAGQYPEHGSRWLAPIRHDARVLSHKAEQNYLDVSSRATGFGDVAGFGGAMAGSFYDPVNVGLMAFGPTGRVGLGAMAILKSGAINGAINAAGEAAMQPFVQEWRKEIQVKHGFKVGATNVLFAGILGGSVDIGGRVAFRRGKDAYRKFKGEATDAQMAAYLKDLEKVGDQKSDSAKEAQIGKAVSHLPKNHDAHKFFLEKDYRPFAKMLRGVDLDQANMLKLSRDNLGAEQANIVDDEMRGAINYLEAEEGRTQLPNVHPVDDEAAQIQTMRHVTNPNEPPAFVLIQEKLEGQSLENNELAKLLDKQGSTIVSMARVLRNNPDMLDSSIGQNNIKMRYAKGLARLSDEAFGLVENERVDGQHAVMVGELVADQTRHVEMLQQLSKANLTSERQARQFTGVLLQIGHAHNSQKILLGVQGDSPKPDLVKAQKEKIEPGSPEAQRQSEHFEAQLIDESTGLAPRDQDIIKRLEQSGVRVTHNLEELDVGDTPKASTIAAAYSDNKKLVYVALNHKAGQKLAHEEIHALKQAGKFSDKEWSLLLEAGRKTGIMTERFGDTGIVRVQHYSQTYQKAGHNKTEIKQLIEQETVAHMIEAREAGGNYGKQVNSLIDKVLAFIRNLSKTMRDIGLKDVEQVFDRIESGEIGKRAGKGKQDGEVFSLEPGKLIDYHDIKENPLGTLKALFGDEDGERIWHGLDNRFSTERTGTDRTRRGKAGDTTGKISKQQSRMDGDRRKNIEIVSGKARTLKIHRIVKAISRREGLNNNVKLERMESQGFEPVFHGTKSDEPYDRAQPSRDEFGFHVGTRRSAVDRLKNIDIRNKQNADEDSLSSVPAKVFHQDKILSLAVRYKKPLKVSDVGAFNDPVSWLSALDEGHWLHKDVDAWLRKFPNFDHSVAQDRKGFNSWLGQHLDAKGYDALVYVNKAEGSGDQSIAVWHPEQLRSLHDRFDPATINSSALMAGDEHLEALSRKLERAIRDNRGLGKGDDIAYSLEPDKKKKSVADILGPEPVIDPEDVLKPIKDDLKEANEALGKVGGEKQGEKKSEKQGEKAEKKPKAKKERSPEELAAAKAIYIEQKRRSAITLAKAQQVKADMLSHVNAKGQRDVVGAALGHIENYGVGKHSAIAQREQQILGESMSIIHEIVLEFERDKLTGQTPKNKMGLLNDMIKESFGEKTGNIDADRMSMAWRESHEYLRQKHNAAGGQIAYMKEWGLPQSHNSRAIGAVPFQEWSAYISPLLDRKKTVHHLTKQPHSDKEWDDMLTHIYESIVTNNVNTAELTLQIKGKGALYKQGSDARFLHFKDADSWQNYAEKFGNVTGTHGADLGFHAMMRHLQSFSRDIAAMEILGPNPHVMLNYMEGIIAQELSAARLGQAAALPVDGHDKEGKPYVKTALGRKLSHDDYVSKGVKKLLYHYDIVRGVLDIPVDREISAWGQAVRNWQVATKLGSAMLSAIGDVATFKMGMMYAGLKNEQMVLKDIYKYMQAEDRHFAVRSGLILDSAMAMIFTESRFGGAVEAATRTGKLADRTLAWSGLTAWTQAAKHAFGMETMANFARVQHLPFDKLDKNMTRLFEHYGLSAQQWDLVRNVKAANHKGVAFLRGVDMKGDADMIAAKQKYMEMIFGETEYAVPSGTVASQAIGKKFQVGTYEGEAWRLFFQFKQYPISVLMMQGGRTMRLMDREGTAAGVKYAAATMTAMTLTGGVFGTWLKDLKAGRDPDMDFTSGKNWGRWMAQGGGVGIFGDFIFADHNRFGGGPLSTFAGPAFGDVAQLLKATAGNVQKLMSGKDTSLGKDLMNVARSNSPVVGSLWYTATAYNRGALDQLQQLADPKASQAFKRRMAKREKDYNGQEYYWPLGDVTPSRAPSASSIGETFSFE